MPAVIVAETHIHKHKQASGKAQRRANTRCPQRLAGLMTCHFTSLCKDEWDTNKNKKKRKIAPNHTDGEADRPTDVDVYVCNNIKSHDVSDADAMTERIYSGQRLWERRQRCL